MPAPVAATPATPPEDRSGEGHALGLLRDGDLMYDTALGRWGPDHIPAGGALVS